MSKCNHTILKLKIYVKLQKEKLKNDKNFYYRALLKNLNRYEVYLQGATRTEDKLDITINQSKYRSYARASGRATRVAASISPPEIKIVFIYIFSFCLFTINIQNMVALFL